MKIKLDEYGIMPERAHATDAGIDIKTPQSFTIFGNCGCAIRTGVHIELPKGTCGLMVSKSGLNVKSGITSTGLIDEGYTGEIVVKLYNDSPNAYHFKKGDKITQLVIIPVLYEPLELSTEIDGGARGNDGFGSTGR